MWFFDLLEDQEEKVKNWNGLCARCRGGELQWRLESPRRRHLRVDIVSWCRADRTCQWKEPGCNLHCCILARTSGRAGWIGLGVHLCEQLVLTFCKSFGRFVLQALFAVFDGHGGSQVSHIASKEFPKAGLRILSRPEKNLGSRNCQTIHNLEHHFLCQHCDTFVSFTSASFGRAARVEPCFG